MAVSSVSNPLYTPETTASANVRTPTKKLGQEDFLKLLSVQFQNQDPMKPMEDAEFIASMAQFTSLEQTNTMSSTIAQLRAEQQVSIANSYLGLFAVVEDAKGNLQSGQVTAVDTTTDRPKLEIGGKYYDLSAVLRTEHPALLSTGTDATTNAGSGA